jgi:hypothetical protein
MKIASIVLAGSLLIGSSVAKAEVLSDVQEGVLYGAGGVILLQHIFKSRQIQQTAGVYPNAGYYPPADPVQKAYEEGVRQRQQAEMQERAARAYDCGRWGTNCEQK